MSNKSKFSGCKMACALDIVAFLVLSALLCCVEAGNSTYRLAARKNESSYADYSKDLKSLLNKSCDEELWRKCHEPASWNAKECRHLHCISRKAPRVLFRMAHNLSKEKEWDQNGFPAIVYESFRECVEARNRTQTGDTAALNKGEVWGFGFLFMTLVNLSSITGVVILPFTKRPFFKWLLQFLISLAVGTLAGCALLFLIPDSFAITELDVKQDYVWKSAVVMAGIYVFFNVERLLRMGIHRAKNKNKDGNDEDEKIDGLLVDNAKNEEEEEEPVENGISKKDSITKKKREIKPVAWMIITGDTLHRCVDGMSVGAAFSLSFFAGVSLAVAIMLEEFPHGLGDLAMLLKAGMSRKEAVLYNLLAALGGFIGLALGVTIGEDINASRWVFAVAAGMFLYVGLVDMLNDVNQAVEEDEEFHNSKCRVLFLQNAGILIGAVAMLLLAAYSGNITFT